MNTHSHWRIFLSQIVADRELYGSLVVAAVLLLGDLLAPAGWTPGFRVIALAILGVGVAFSVYNHFRTSALINGNKPVPLVVAVEVERRNALRDVELARDAIIRTTGFDAFAKVESFFNVHYEDLLTHRTERLPPDPAMWEKFLEQAQREASRFQQHLAGGRIFHVFIHGPASLALGLGAILGTRNPVMVYHYTDGVYQRVMDLSHDIRRIKAAAPAHTEPQIQVKVPERLERETAVVLNLASHTASGYVASYLSNQGNPMPIVEVSNTYQGDLPVGDWVPVVQEIYQVFRTIQQSPQQVQHLHLFHSIPVPLALGLGMALGTVTPVTVYNWERSQETYYPVLQLNRLESLL